MLFNSPHSGRVYPRAFLQTSRLDLPTLRRSEDSFVDELALGVVARGYPLMRAHFPRCYVDVNREPYELDPRMFEGRLPSFANTRSMRVAGGLGTVARVVGDAQEIYDQRISVDDALRRIESLYKPYHRALRRLFTRVHREFGAAMLIDCHSMPSSTGPKDERPRADVVLGDRYGTSCVGAVSETIEIDVARAGLCGQPQQALRRRLHHRALRQPGRRACMQSSSSSTGRCIWTSAASSVPQDSAAWPRTWRRWPTGWPPSRCRSCGPTALPPNSVPRANCPPCQKKKKGRRTCRRPKSREETPKEGGGNRREPVAALHKYAPAPHKKQVFLTYSAHGCS